MAQKKIMKNTAKRRTTASKRAPRRAKARGDARRPAPGTTLTRRFKGADHVVKVTADGFTYAGTTYRSLTQIAKLITQYPSVSGPRFFGTDEASKAKGGAK